MLPLYALEKLHHIRKEYRQLCIKILFENKEVNELIVERFFQMRKETKAYDDVKRNKIYHVLADFFCCSVWYVRELVTKYRREIGHKHHKRK